MVPEMFVVGWFQTLFTYLTVLPSETLDRVWDIFMFERDWKIMFRLGLALLEVAESSVVGHSIETTMSVINTFQDPLLAQLEPGLIINKALSIKVTNVVLHHLREELRESSREDAASVKI